jgi:hypothetical protein
VNDVVFVRMVNGIDSRDFGVLLFIGLVFVFMAFSNLNLKKYALV